MQILYAGTLLYTNVDFLKSEGYLPLCDDVGERAVTIPAKHARSARFLRDIWTTFRVQISKLQANVATRHDIKVYFFQADVFGRVATSTPKANRVPG